MSFTNSPLVSFALISPNRGTRTQPISRISIHCVVGQCIVEALGALFSQSSRKASSNYGIGYDGKVGMFVEEKDRSWCTSSSFNDDRAVTIEVASDTTHPYAVRAAAYDTLLDLVTDICRRNGKSKVVWISDKDTALAYVPAAGEMLLTIHRWYANKACPGQDLLDRHAAIAAEVNKRLAGAQDVAVTPTPTPTTAPTELTAGMKLALSATACYSAAAAESPYTTRSGTFYLWSAAAVNGRVRITIREEYVGVSGKATCWITEDDAKFCAVVQAAIEPTPAPAPAPAVTECTVTLPVLGKGSDGEAVRALQILLNGRLDLRLQKDGAFGAATQKAVVDFQQKNGLAADGTVEAKTWAKLLNNT